MIVYICFIIATISVGINHTNDVSRLRKPAKFYLREDCEFAILLDYLYLYR